MKVVGTETPKYYTVVIIMKGTKVGKVGFIASVKFIV